MVKTIKLTGGCGFQIQTCTQRFFFWRGKGYLSHPYEISLRGTHFSQGPSHFMHLAYAFYSLLPPMLTIVEFPTFFAIDVPDKEEAKLFLSNIVIRWLFPCRISLPNFMPNFMSKLIYCRALILNFVMKLLLCRILIPIRKTLLLNFMVSWKRERSPSRICMASIWKSCQRSKWIKSYQR